MGVHEAKAPPSRLLERVEAGEEIEISRQCEVVARLVAAGGRRRPQLSGDEGIEIPDDFDDPMPDDWLDLLYRGHIVPA